MKALYYVQSLGGCINDASIELLIRIHSWIINAQNEVATFDADTKSFWVK
ncbi:MAG: hypothetical protein JST89_14760 [Cyanobacteria bacterium SZAS-4]|nr:hypothetical protein [Cyanobacteria bacterium SZAS-4]